MVRNQRSKRKSWKYLIKTTNQNIRVMINKKNTQECLQTGGNKEDKCTMRSGEVPGVAGGC